MAMAKRLRIGSRRLAGLALGLLSFVFPAASSQAKTAEKSSGAGAQEGDKAQANIVLQEQLTEFITTSGEGKIVAKPDAMRAELGVEVQAKTLDQAQSELARKMALVTSAIEKLGLEGLTLQTETLEIHPVQSKPEAGRAPKIVGYRAQNTLSVTLRLAEAQALGTQAAKVIDAAVGAGANVVEGISFFLARPEEAQAKALHLAVVDAERNAKILAASSGVRLLGLHSLDGSQGRLTPIWRDAGIAKASRELRTTIEPGELTITATVAARYHFANQ
ncbi:SIMPL domain-containing protein [Polyangium jinanense]|uniref:SIMPL domain-containing protein n=1 Tax=Polyangium jinanense TaxID=2829994 RepID=A0A9X4AR34_9BACT|nr:SIMPL domain-containing protein [Polyangium jinanense]MDC3954733.1 SIMPL domain-containing protein [Polyangium jinanense]MDC3961919.1 SIMPL domain-containing protein [Polyangium jinanense]MDC3981036.1 SIMPL domain-containing protein [Polyangium jinanense]